MHVEDLHYDEYLINLDTMKLECLSLQADMLTG